MNNEDIERVANSLMEKNNVSVRRCRRHMDVAREPRINLITLFFCAFVKFLSVFEIHRSEEKSKEQGFED